jgi:hypothetical protein
MIRRALPVGRDDMLARQPAGRQRQEQRPEPDRACRWCGVGTHGGSGGPEEAMNWRRRLAALFVMLALAACAQGGQVPYAPENIHDRGGDGGGGGMM